MKFYNVLIITLILGILCSSFSSAEEQEYDYKEFTDIVYEWTPNGNMIQVGDYIISDIRSVWLDKGDKELVQVSKSYIKEGRLVRVLLINKDNNGFWIAHKIIVFSGKRLKTAIKQLSSIKRKELSGMSN